MQKQKKQMIVLVILLILLILAYIGVHFYSKKQEEKENAKEEAEKIQVTDLEVSDITQFSYVLDGTTLSFTKNGTEWTYDGDQSVDIDESALETLLNKASAITASDEVTEYDDLADRYRKLAADGAGKLDKVSWNGEFYEQVLDNVNAYRYQYGKGCLSDQLLGQYMAFNAQLGYILPEEHVKKAVQSVFEYNFVEKAKKNVHAERAYILNDEKGLTPCTWPNGGKPIFPFVYYGEVWTGIEYEVAALLVRTDQVNEALTIVKALRDRQDGFKRNPFSENESGYYYTRAMASWAVYEALLGYHYDMRKQEQSFEPKLNEDHFDGFWCNGRQWGVVHQRKDNDGTLYQTTEVLYDAVKM